MNSNHKTFLRIFITCGFIWVLQAKIFPCAGQNMPAKANDVNTPLHLLKPAYVTPYGETTQANVKVVLDRIYKYQEDTTTTKLVDQKSNEIITDFLKANSGSGFKPGDFRLV